MRGPYQSPLRSGSLYAGAGKLTPFSPSSPPSRCSYIRHQVGASILYHKREARLPRWYCWGFNDATILNAADIGLFSASSASFPRLNTPPVIRAYPYAETKLSSAKTVRMCLSSLSFNACGIRRLSADRLYGLQVFISRTWRATELRSIVTQEASQLAAWINQIPPKTFRRTEPRGKCSR